MIQGTGLGGPPAFARERATRGVRRLGLARKGDGLE